VFASVYIYRVPRQNVDAFLSVQREAAAIYRQHGAADDETYAARDLEPKYGCAGFMQVLATEGDEELLIGLTRFQDQAHRDRVMARVDADPRINQLYNKVTTLLDVGRIVRGEFERVA